MSEQLQQPELPDSITNNYAVHERASGLLVAESRMNHQYDEHPHAAQEETPAEESVKKTRGIVYTETELNGKPIIIAERPGSRHARQPEAVETTDGDDEGEHEPNWVMADGESDDDEPKTELVDDDAVEDRNDVPYAFDIDESDAAEEEASDAGSKKRGGKIRNLMKNAGILSDETRESFQHDENEGEEAVSEPVEDTSSAGLRDRAKGIMGRTWDKLKDLPTLAMVKAQSANAAEAGQTSEEYKTARNRRKLLAAGAGALALIGGAYLVSKGISGSGSGVHHGSHEALQGMSGGKSGGLVPGHDVFPDHSHIAGGVGHHEAVQHATHAVDNATEVHHPTTISLESGQNPWTVSEHQLQAHGIEHPTNAQILAYDDRLRQLNHISLAEARHLPVGTKLKLPRFFS